MRFRRVWKEVVVHVSPGPLGGPPRVLFRQRFPVKVYSSHETTTRRKRRLKPKTRKP